MRRGHLRDKAARCARTMEWFKNSEHIIREKYPSVIELFESMDRDQLIAEGCRLYFTAKDYLATLCYHIDKERMKKGKF